MSEANKPVVEETTNENEKVVKLSKPYVFEGTTYNEINLEGLDNITAKDMIEANKVLDRSGGFSIMPELQMEYACVIASRATGYPIEYFYGLPPKDAIKVKNKVTSFFYGQD